MIFATKCAIEPLSLNKWFQNFENSVSSFVTGYECFQDPMSKTILTETLTSCDRNDKSLVC